MKYVLVAMMGAADEPCEELSDKTPFEVAKLPNLNYFARMGKVGQAKFASDRFDSLVDVSLLNLLGYDAEKTYTGIGPLEAANQNLKLEDNEIAFRMNFITESDSRLADATGGKLTTKEAKAMINFLNKKIASDFVRFFAGTEYRHIAVIKDAHGYEALSAKTYDPHMIQGEKIESYFPKGPGDELLKKLMFDAKLLLQDHEINQVRLDLQENPANMIWLWGQGRWPHLANFSDRFSISSAIISSLECVKGIGRLSGMTVVDLDLSKVEDREAEYGRKAKALSEALKEKDFVCLVLKGSHEASLKGDLKAKISAIEGTDYFILGRLREWMEQFKDIKVLITPGYGISWKKQEVLKDSVPFVIAGKNVTPDDIEKFSELTAKNSELKPKVQELMPLFLAR